MKLIIYPLLPFLILILLAGCSSENQPGMPPLISSVSPDTAFMGDTVYIEGERFNPDLWKNRIAFSPGLAYGNPIDRLVIPFAGSNDYLWAVVPDGAFSGSVKAEQLNPLGSAYPMSAGLAVIPTLPLPFCVELSRGDVAKAFFNSPTSEFHLPTGGVISHLMVIFSNSIPPDTSTMYDYTLEFDAATASPLWSDSKERDFDIGKMAGAGYVTEKASAGSSHSKKQADLDFTGGAGTRTSDLDRRKREDLQDILKRSRPRTLYELKERGISPVQPDAAPPASAVFDVYSNLDGRTDRPENFTKVEANLEYDGNHTLLYLDSSTDPGCISSQEAQLIGQAFDQAIYDTDRQFFGEESDINGDGKVAILLSPVVNELTPPGEALAEGYIAGFFLPGDLVPSLVHEDCTNGMEIFYTIVPDPSGIYGNVFEKERALESIEGILGHEFVHMIMFNYRVLKYGQGLIAAYIEETWLEEGMAHIAEGLNGYFGGNIARANRFLRNPGDFSLTYGKDGLAERGAAYLFLRYLGDRFGDSIFRDLAQSRNSGMKNVEDVVGEDFLDLFGDWAAAMYLSGRGITGDSRFEYTSIDLLGDFDQLKVEELDAVLSPFPGAVKSMGLDYIELNLPWETSYEGLLESGGGSMNAVIIRLD